MRDCLCVQAKSLHRLMVILTLRNGGKVHHDPHETWRAYVLAPSARARPVCTPYRAHGACREQHEEFKQFSVLVRSAPTPLGLPVRSLSPALNPFGCIQMDAGASLQMQAACGLSCCSLFLYTAPIVVAVYPWTRNREAFQGQRF